MKISKLFICLFSVIFLSVFEFKPLITHSVDIDDLQYQQVAVEPYMKQSILNRFSGSLLCESLITGLGYNSTGDGWVDSTATIFVWINSDFNMCISGFMNSLEQVKVEIINKDIYYAGTYCNVIENREKVSVSQTTTGYVLLLEPNNLNSTLRPYAPTDWYTLFDLYTCSLTDTITIKVSNEKETNEINIDIGKIPRPDVITPIYRKSVTHTTDIGNVYTTNVVADHFGHIHIDINCAQLQYSYGNSLENIGYIDVNDSFYYWRTTDWNATIPEYGLNASYITNMKNTKYLESYVGQNKKINLYIPYDTSNIATTVMQIDLYVKPEYLNTTQTINVFGEDIVIPFGEDVIEDKDEQIAKLMKEIEILKATPLEYDYNKDGLLTLSDIIYLARYLAEDDTLPVK